MRKTAKLPFNGLVGMTTFGIYARYLTGLYAVDVDINNSLLILPHEMFYLDTLCTNNTIKIINKGWTL